MDKATLRKAALSRRRAYVETLTPGTLERISMALVDRFQDYFKVPQEYVIGTYFPREDELNVRLLNFTFQEDGHVVAYPRIESAHELSYRAVQSPKVLEESEFGVRQSPATAPVVHPDLIFVPLVAFDDRCHRLGYGRGHMDRTLQKARADRNVLVIGVGYDMQRIDEIPNEPLDEQLDYVVTESQIYKADKQ
jgi:5-formyltetrahydrofolate cyclo-ligase